MALDIVTEDTAEKPSEKEVKTIINSVYTASAASVLKTLKAKDGFLWLSARKEENEKKILPIEAWPEHIDVSLEFVDTGVLQRQSSLVFSPSGSN